jgi:hypothetical protein
MIMKMVLRLAKPARVREAGEAGREANTSLVFFETNFIILFFLHRLLTILLHDPGTPSNIYTNFSRLER